MVANRAMAQAWAAGKHAAGGKTPPFRPESVVSAVYSAPQVAQVGSLAGRRARLSYGAAMKPHLGEHAAGFIEMAVAEDGRLLGALAVGDHAADLLAPVAVAIQAGMDAAHFGALYAAHPTVSELAFMVARQFN